MIQILVVTLIILALAMLLLSVKVIFRRNGRFTSPHIHDSQAMRDRGIGCVLEQDREARSGCATAVSASSKNEKAKDSDKK